MWVPCQIWVHPLACFWIQVGFKSGLNSRGSQFITVTGPTFLLFSPFFLSPPEVSLLLSLALGHYRAQTPLPSSPITEPHILITHFPKQTRNYNITSIQINEPSKMISQILFLFTKYFLKKTKTTAIHPFVKIVVQNFVYTLKNKLLLHKDLNFK